MFGPLSVFLAAETEVAQVAISRVRGSSPREAGTKMFVSSGAVHGTIGGGQLEYMAIDAARAMLRRGDDAQTLHIPLGPEIGQCCGGRVELRLIRLTSEDRARLADTDARTQAERPHVYICGAGHVGRALADFFQHLPVQTVLLDGREAELALCGATVETRLSVLPEADIRAAPAGSVFIVLTHDHALDFLLTSEALARGDAGYVGMIGSATKRASFANWCARQAPHAALGPLVCPIGATASDDKRPEVIAAFVVAEVMTALTVKAKTRPRTSA